MPSHTIPEIIQRLEVLYRKLDDEGWHVRANTVALAIEALKSAQNPAAGALFDKSIIRNPAFESDDVTWLQKRALTALARARGKQS